MLNNIGIGKRLSIGFGIIVFILLCVIVYSITSLVKVSNYMNDFYTHSYFASNSLREANIDIVRMQRSMKDVLLIEDIKDLDNIFKTVDGYEKDVLMHLQNAKERFLGDTQEFDKLITEFKAWKPVRDEEFSLMRAGKKREAVEITKSSASQHVEMLSEMRRDLTSISDDNAKRYYMEANSNSKRTIILTVVLSLAVIILTIVIALLITRSIVNPLKTAVDIAKRIETGDIKKTVEVTSNDELGNLLNSMNNMSTKLRNQIEEITKSINVVSTSASELSSSTAQLSTSVSETGASVNETTTTVEEVLQTSQISNQKAKSVSERAQKMVKISENGKHAVDATREGMNRVQAQMKSIGESIMRLSEQSQAIGEIIASVDDLSDQSSLLAVNAAIEAAKAGEHGKGFTIVAQEVKSLAEQSKKATTRVRTILNDIQKATGIAVMATEKGTKIVESGVGQFIQADESIMALTNSIEESTQAATQIAASSQQQMVGMEQVGRAIEDIKQASLQNTASIKQLDVSAQNLKELGEQLKDLVGYYKM